MIVAGMRQRSPPGRPASVASTEGGREGSGPAAFPAADPERGSVGRRGGAGNHGRGGRDLGEQLRAAKATLRLGGRCEPSWHCKARGSSSGFMATPWWPGKH